MKEAMNFVKRFLTLGICFWMGFLIPGLSGLSGNDVSLVFGSPIKEGDDLKLLCLFTVPQNVTIYTVKWYKGTREIFRYLPKDRQKQKIPFSDLTIDERHSDMNTLILKQVPAYMTGTVSCEVTPEPPSNLVMKTSLLLVVVPPKEKPRLETSLGMTNQMLTLNQKMIANCTSAPSKPAVNITFYINDLQVRTDDPNVGIRMQRQLKDEYEVQFAEMELQLQQQYFKDGKIRLRCEASLFQLYNGLSDDFLGELAKPKSQKQGSIFGVGGGASQIKSGTLIIVGLYTVLLATYRHFFSSQVSRDCVSCH